MAKPVELSVEPPSKETLPVEPTTEAAEASIEIAAPTSTKSVPSPVVANGKIEPDDEREVDELNEAQLALLARIQQVRELSSAS